MTTVRYSVWVSVDAEDDDYHTEHLKAFRAIPGYVEHSWEDSYED